MILRPFTDADVPGWVALSNLVLDRQGTVDSFRAEEARRNPAHPMRRWVMSDGAQVVGMAARYFWPFDPPGFLHASVLVHPERRGKGLGGSLWKAVLEGHDQRSVGLATDVSDVDPGSVAWAEWRGFHIHAHRFASNSTWAPSTRRLFRLIWSASPPRASPSPIWQGPTRPRWSAT